MEFCTMQWVVTRKSPVGVLFILHEPYSTAAVSPYIRVYARVRRAARESERAHTAGYVREREQRELRAHIRGG